jgi:hypothetical protein
MNMNKMAVSVVLVVLLSTGNAIADIAIEAKADASEVQIGSRKITGANGIAVVGGNENSGNFIGFLTKEALVKFKQNGNSDILVPPASYASKHGPEMYYVVIEKGIVRAWPCVFSSEIREGVWRGEMTYWSQAGRIRMNEWIKYVPDYRRMVER